MQRSIVLKQLKEYVALSLLDGDDAGLDETTPLFEWGVINSLTMTRLLNFIQSQFQVYIALENVVASHFETLGAITDLIVHMAGIQGIDAQAQMRSAPERRMSVEEDIPLSFTQQQVWFLQQLEPDLVAYNEFIALQIRGSLQIDVLERSFNEIIRRHEILRTVFPVCEGHAVQRILPWKSVTLKKRDFSQLLAPDRESAAKQLAGQEIRTHLDLAHGPLLSGTVYQLEQEVYYFLVVFHHMITDGWSMGIFLRELAALYAMYTMGTPAPLSELPIQYADLACWQQRELQEESLKPQWEYWQKQLTDAPRVLELPIAHPRPTRQAYQGAHVEFEIPIVLQQALNEMSQQRGVTLFTTLLTAFQVLLYRYTSQEDFLIGVPATNRSHAEMEHLIGPCINMLVVRGNMAGNPAFDHLLKRVHKEITDAYAHKDFPFDWLVKALQLERDVSRSPLFQIMFNMQEASWISTEIAGLEVEPLHLESGSAKFDLTLAMIESKEILRGSVEYNINLFSEEAIARLVGHFQVLLDAIVRDPLKCINEMPLLTLTEQKQFSAWNNTYSPLPPNSCIHHLIEEQVECTPDAIAIIYGGKQLTYAELNRKANQLAYHLRALGVASGTFVGLCIERSLEMIIGLLGILKAGAAYVPLDPGYPQERLAFIINDASIAVVLTQQYCLEKLPHHGTGMRTVCLDRAAEEIDRQPDSNGCSSTGSHDLAYMIYTSGSTGLPKGVMVSHENVVNFFVGMEQHIKVEPDHKVWLAVTSISFDISVLELFWTLAHGFKTIILAHQQGLPLLKAPAQQARSRKLDFSLFYFATTDETTPVDEKYQLLLDGARFADQHDFIAVWTPERHFHPFGGLYPNPAVTSAAIATITEHIQLRAGSLVLPLHNPLRVAEEWSVVDNLSKGRVSISFATGWQTNDFVLAPENYAQRKEIMLREIEMVRRLWRGEAITQRNGSGLPVAIKIFPSPVQPELPVWITTSGNAETFRQAGASGAHLLTHLLGQEIDQLADKIALYRQERQLHGYDPDQGRVALMLHTFVGEDSSLVLEKVRKPFLTYLKSSFQLMKDFTQNVGVDIADPQLTEDDIDTLLTHAFNRFYQTSSLIGTPATCLPLLEQLRAIGVDEIACLIDFGVDYEAVRGSLYALNDLREKWNLTEHRQSDGDDYSFAALMEKYHVSHLQCTPSLARILVSDPEILQSMKQLQVLLLGGEALPAELGRQLKKELPGTLLNMYGPTETTIWSTCHAVAETEKPISIGRPIANTQVYLLDSHLQQVPVGIPGELVIGGTGVTSGYYKRPELTAERFIPDFSRSDASTRLYRTGDLARYSSDGTIVYVGRMDRQVKLQGVRIEPAEIEYMLNEHPAVQQSCVVPYTDDAGKQYLVAYIVLNEQSTLPVQELRKYLRKKLPDSMLPAAFLSKDALPLTPNGKLDYQALAHIQQVSLDAPETFVAPRSTLELMLARLWADVLQREQIGIYDNFFSSGGHSLLATQLILRIRAALHIDVSLASLFEAPTIAGLIEHILEQQFQRIGSDIQEQILMDVEQQGLSG